MPMFAVYLNNQHNPFIKYTDDHVCCKYCQELNIKVLRPYKKIEKCPKFIDHIFGNSNCKLARKVYEHLHGKQTNLTNVQKEFIAKMTTIC